MILAAATLTSGQALPAHTITAVRSEDIALVALVLRDPNPIHFDLAEVQRLGLGDRVVNQGGATMAYVANYLADLAGSRAAIKTLACEFRGNVLAGDDVTVAGTVTTVEDTPDGRLIGCDVFVDVVGGKRAITGSASILITVAP